MKRINKHIQIVRSTNKQLSSMSQVSCDALFTLLSKHYRRVGVSTVNNLGDLESLVALNPDLAFMGMNSIPTVEGADPHNSPKIWLSQYLDENDISYTGSGSIAHKLESDKSLAKLRVQESGLETSGFFVARQNVPIIESRNTLSFPLFVKPVDRGGGLGIDSMSVVHNFKQLKNKVRQITGSYSSDSLVEEYLDGREFSVAVLKDNSSSELFVMPLELIAPEDEFGSRLLSESVKTHDSETFIEISDHILKSKISKLAEKVFVSLGARDYGRIDIRLDSSGQPNFLEANLIPSLIEGYGNFPKACFINEGLDYESIILRIVDLGFARSYPVEVETKVKILSPSF